MSKLIMIDSQIFIWGIKGQSSTGQESDVTRAKGFVQWLSDNAYKILMPVPQLIELLSYVPTEHQHQIRQFIDKRFMIVPVDELVATKCAELIYLSLNEPELIEYRAKFSVPKNKIKFDCMLVASAIVRGANRIYSEDPDLKKFAHGQIDVLPIPTVGVQNELFNLKEMK